MFRTLFFGLHCIHLSVISMRSCKFVQRVKYWDTYWIFQHSPSYRVDICTWLDCFTSRSTLWVNHWKYDRISWQQTWQVNKSSRSSIMGKGELLQNWKCSTHIILLMTSANVLNDLGREELEISNFDLLLFYLHDDLNVLACRSQLVVLVFNLSSVLTSRDKLEGTK